MPWYTTADAVRDAHRQGEDKDHARFAGCRDGLHPNTNDERNAL